MQPLSFDELKQELETVYTEVKRAANIIFRFSRPDTNTHQNSYTFYLLYEGPLPITTPKEIKVDVTIKEKIFYSPEEQAIIKSYEEYTDLLEGEKILVYSLDEIATEKTVALHDRARTEPRDLYDLWYLIEQSNLVNLIDCIKAINEKLAHRGKNLDEIRQEFSKKEARLKKTWEIRLSGQMASLLEFDKIYRSVKRAFRQAKISN